MKHLRSSIGSAVAAMALLSASASAEPTAGKQATAEALFEQGSQLVDAGRFSEACEKFAASQELDPGLGTLLYLADCYDRAGRSASAWALFRDVQERAKRVGQLDRAQIAVERATALEAKLSRLELSVPSSRQLLGLELWLGGTAVPKASWNVALPVDPGNVRLEARAPGRRTLSIDISVPSGPSKKVVVLPELALAPAVKHASAPPVGAERSGLSPQRTIGFVAGGVGVLALAAGGFFGYRAYSLNNSSKAQCRTDSPNACTPEDVSLRDQASASARLSTITSLAGALVVAGGATLIFTAPSPLSDSRARAAALELRGTW